MKNFKIVFAKIIPYILPISLIILSITFSVIIIFISVNRALTPLEGSLFQFVILGLSLAGSYYIGKLSSKKMAIEIIKPHARSSFRRLLSLYKSLSRVAILVQDADKTVETKLEKIDSIIIEQIATADDALEDWKDIIPDEVEDILNKIKKSER